MRRGRLVSALAAVVLGVGLGGCGVADVVVGVHDAPSESPTGAPLSAHSAERITTRVLTLAAEARAESGKKAAKARKEALAGPALQVAEVKADYRDASATAPDPVNKPSEPTVLAISRGRAWPRVILATTLTDGVQRLHVLTSDSATEPFKLFASVSMAPGSSVPAVGPLQDGTEVVTGGEGLVASPAKALKDYATAIAFPQPKKRPKTVATDDAFATTLRSNEKDQKQRLKDLAKLKSEHSLRKNSVIAFRLADGSALAFGQLTRTDMITTTSDAKELVLPDDLAALVGKTKVTDHLRIKALETIAMRVPTSGQAGVIGADEQRTSVTGS